MDIDATFLPVAKELIDSVFPTTVAYIRNNGGSYDPSTGEVVLDITQFSINAGILSRGRLEEGVGESYSCGFGSTTAPVGCLICPLPAIRWSTSV